jgi:hypothetical protein
MTSGHHLLHLHAVQPRLGHLSAHVGHQARKGGLEGFVRHVQFDTTDFRLVRDVL